MWWIKSIKYHEAWIWAHIVLYEMDRVFDPFWILSLLFPLDVSSLQLQILINSSAHFLPHHQQQQQQQQYSDTDGNILLSKFDRFFFSPIFIHLLVMEQTAKSAHEWVKTLNPLIQDSPFHPGLMKSQRSSASVIMSLVSPSCLHDTLTPSSSSEKHDICLWESSGLDDFPKGRT